MRTQGSVYSKERKSDEMYDRTVCLSVATDGSRRQVVRLRVNGVNANCLIDTGADRSIVSDALVNAIVMNNPDRTIIEPTGTRVRAEGGTYLQVRGVATLDLGTPNGTVPWRCVVVNGLLHEMILGNDFFKNFNATIVLDSSSLLGVR